MDTQQVLERFVITIPKFDEARVDPDDRTTRVKVFTSEIEVDPALLPDDEWRSTFYHHVKTLKDVAEHIVWNRAVMGFPEVEGFADRDEGVHWRFIKTTYEWVDLDDIEE